ncbi:MAG: hypothetical protein KBT03_13020 [Bacteroidales bacterium]|nr:hypothetical protein [Candidatus Scybalousia scybalohippi]
MKRKVQIYEYEKVNSLLDRIEKLSNVVYNTFYEDRDKSYQSLYCYSFCKFNNKNVTITTRWGENLLPTTYVFTRDHTPAHLKQGSEEYALLKRAGGEYIPDFANDEWAIEHLGKQDGKFTTKNAGIQKYNPKFNHLNVYAYEYDLKSAYLSVMYDKIPDTRYPMYNHTLEEGEIGFIVTDKLVLIKEPGLEVEIAFKLIETPSKLRNYCTRWFNRKEQKDDETLKRTAKSQIVDPIGYLQYHNPYLRAYIVETCNYKIESLIDSEHFILCNTDAIFSDVKLDLDIGPKLGQFKLNEGYMSLDGLNYDSDEFGDVHRGKQKNNYYEVVNNRLVKLEEIE